MEKEYVIMLIDALMSIEKIESFIVSITDGHGITGKEYVNIANVYEVLWMVSKYYNTTDDKNHAYFEETITSNSLTTEEKYNLLFS